MKMKDQVGPAADKMADPQHDHITNDALSAALSSSTQTYDQFLQGFIHLTAADVAPSVMQNAFGDLPHPPFFLQSNSATRSQSPPLFLQPETPCRPASPPLALSTVTPGDEDFEEVLMCDPPTSDGGRKPRSKRLQMDNFVCEEESDEDEDLQDLGCEYSASFTTPDCRRREVVKELLGDCEVRAEPETSVSVKPVKPVNEEQPKVPEEESILDLIDSGDEDDLVYDPSLDRPNPGEVEDTPESGVATVTNVREMTYSARFAEAGETPTCLHSNTSQDALGAMVDEVEAFTLDEDFDYDNVILTPKFTMEERKYLDELASRGRQEADVEGQEKDNFDS